MKREELEAVRERVAKATGPDREIDDEVWAALGGVKAGLYGMPAVTGSVDAALALIDAVLPGWWFVLCSDKPRAVLHSPDHKWEQYTAGDETRTDTISGMSVSAEGQTLSLALLSALLSALADSPEQK